MRVLLRGVALPEGKKLREGCLMDWDVFEIPLPVHSDA